MAHAVRGKVGNLPQDLTSFVGRRREVTEARRLLASSRLVTLTGIAGVGKTRLALRVATDAQRAFDDGVWLVEFGERREPQLVPERVAAALGLREQSAVPTMQFLTDYMSTRNTLLILDNCEHLIDAIAKLAETLLRASPELRILATSREPLAIGGEAVLRVPPLTFPTSEEATKPRALAQYEAVNLFTERAAAAVPGFELNESNRDQVVAICSELDGLPLSIELAAARLRAMSIDQILELLTDRFRLLTGGSRAAPDRQQTLRMSIDWSHDLCTPTEQQMWRRLSIFSHGFELDAAEAIAAPDLTPTYLLDVVAALVDKSILIREEHDGIVRYRLLKTLRDYGRQRLHEAGEYANLRRQHRDWYQDLVWKADHEWIGPNQTAWIGRIDRERPNLHDALEYCMTEPGEAEDGLRIAYSMYRFWGSRGLLNEGRLWLDRTLAAQGGEPTADRVKALFAAISLAANQGDVAAGKVLVAEAYEIAARLEDSEIEVVVALADAILALFSGETQKTMQLSHKILDTVRAGPDRPLHIQTLLALTMGAAVLGERREAVEYSDEVIAITTECGESIYRSYALSFRGLALWRDDPEDTVPLFRQALQLSEGVDDLLGVAIGTEGLAWTTTLQHEYWRAAVLLGAAESLWLAVGYESMGIKKLHSNRGESRTQLLRALGPRTFESAVHLGAGLALSEIVTFAVEDRLPEESSAERSSTDLTPREQEVAELVARGMTNKAIADQLVISQRTAQGHVEHILAKLAFNSRTQIAAWVIEQGKAARNDAV
ncbi:LuxR family transcriptional regulator [Rhodococcus spongiicola]|uniref:LuxR family transcriptional regulator n=1 Tax=Rhodococcus spongiicola TaxID=2487352 RepID=A0A3S3B1L4_9NOCA|nr:LuxR family transcriptional regulator [Rhodococcus spongiicola]